MAKQILERSGYDEKFIKNDFEEIGITNEFVQDNQSKSKKGVLRGLHFQKENTQAKLVRCIKGEVFDVAVDLRPGSETYGKWEGVVLSEENKKMFNLIATAAAATADAAKAKPANPIMQMVPIILIFVVFMLFNLICKYSILMQK